MKMKRAALAIASAALLVPVSSMASLVTVDFQNLSAGSYNSNLVSNGVRFSPKCHYDVRTNFNDIRPGYTGHTAIGWDVSGCDVFNNADYLGPAAGNGPLYIDMFGSHFSLTAMDLVFQDISAAAHGHPRRAAASRSPTISSRPVRSSTSTSMRPSGPTSSG